MAIHLCLGIRNKRPHTASLRPHSLSFRLSCQFRRRPTDSCTLYYMTCEPGTPIRQACHIGSRSSTANPPLYHFCMPHTLKRFVAAFLKTLPHRNPVFRTDSYILIFVIYSQPWMHSYPMALARRDIPIYKGANWRIASSTIRSVVEYPRGSTPPQPILRDRGFRGRRQTSAGETRYLHHLGAFMCGTCKSLVPFLRRITHLMWYISGVTLVWFHPPCGLYGIGNTRLL